MIRKAGFEDLKQCSDVICRVIGEVESRYYSPDIIKGWQKYNSAQNLRDKANEIEFVVWEENGVFLGVGAVEDDCIKKLYILPSAQGKGIGKSLLIELEKIANNKGIKDLVLYSTINAIKFYKKFGYEEQGPFVVNDDGLSVTFTTMTKKNI